MTNDQTVTQALEPCPFCGGEAERFTIGDDEPSNAGGDVITCSKCGASSHVEFGRKENLVSCWNTRTAHSGEGQGWIVGNADGTKWRTWNIAGPEWTYDREQAIRYARRIDAERTHADDEDAWRIIPYSGEGRSNGAGEDGEHLHAMHAMPVRAGTRAREILACTFEPQFPVDAEKARKGLHFMLPSSWAVEAIHAALAAPQGGVEREADAFLVEWVRDGETWVEAHADEVRAADQARKHGVEYVPLYRAALAQPEAGGE